MTLKNATATLLCFELKSSGKNCLFDSFTTNVCGTAKMHGSGNRRGSMWFILAARVNEVMLGFKWL